MGAQDLYDETGRLWQQSYVPAMAAADAVLDFMPGIELPVSKADFAEFSALVDAWIRAWEGTTRATDSWIAAWRAFAKTATGADDIAALEQTQTLVEQWRERLGQKMNGTAADVDFWATRAAALAPDPTLFDLLKGRLGDLGNGPAFTIFPDSWGPWLAVGGLGALALGLFWIFGRPAGARK
jgi:hypothetical protein